MINILDSYFKVPGHPNKGQYHSITLTGRSLTSIRKFTCPALKYPCFFPPLRAGKSTKSLKETSRAKYSDDNQIKVNLKMFLFSGSLIQLAD